MIQYQILPTNITRTVWQTVRRITKEILGVKGFNTLTMTLSARSFMEQNKLQALYRERDKFGVEVNKVLLKDVNTIIKLGIIISKNDIT